MSCRALVEDLGCEVHPTRPGDRADLGVDPYLCEERRVVQWGEYAVPHADVGKIDIAYQAVGEGEPEPVADVQGISTHHGRRLGQIGGLKGWGQRKPRARSASSIAWRRPPAVVARTTSDGLVRGRRA
jgi:hypothetical protein